MVGQLWNQIFVATGFSSLITEWINKRGKEWMEGKGFQDQAYFRQAMSGLDRKQKRNIQRVIKLLINGGFKRVWIAFRVTVALAEAATPVSTTKSNKQQEGQKQSKASKTFSMGTKVLRGYLNQFTDGNNFDADAMVKYLKLEMQNPKEDLRQWLTQSVGALKKGMKSLQDAANEAFVDGKIVRKQMADDLFDKALGFERRMKDKYSA
jgi:hypothetical protein